MCHMVKAAVGCSAEGCYVFGHLKSSSNSFSFRCINSFPCIDEGKWASGHAGFLSWSKLSVPLNVKMDTKRALKADIK